MDTDTTEEHLTIPELASMREALLPSGKEDPLVQGLDDRLAAAKAKQDKAKAAPVRVRDAERVVAHKRNEAEQQQ
eukprot:12912661-Prorocentrum_lima.AAC.1